MAMAERLNAAADQTAPTEPVRGSIGWVIAKYHDSDKYQKLAKNTLKYYRRFLRDIEALGPALPFSSFTRRATVDFVESYPKASQRLKAAAVLKSLFQIGRYYGSIAVDEAAGLQLKTSSPRDRVWSDEEIAAWIEAAESPEMVTAFLLLQFTAQRPGDALKMSWPQYSGSAIRLRQEKTGTLLDVPVHPVLRDHLNGLDRSGRDSEFITVRNNSRNFPNRSSGLSLTIVASRGRPMSYRRFNDRFREIAERVGIDAQARDLRRTAMLRMAEAGATTAQIASVSGHSIDSTQRILETYLPRNRDLAEIAITRLVEYKKRTGV
jgi:integrase